MVRGSELESADATGVRVTRTVVVRSVRLPRRLFNVFVELEGMYRNMVEQLVMYASRNEITSFIKLKALKYRELRSLYPHLPSHYAYTACQDAVTRVKSFMKRKRKGLARKEQPEVRRVSIWLDDHLWERSTLTSIKIATHRGWVNVEFEPHKQYWKYINKGWRLASEIRIKLDRGNKQLLIYLVFVKDVKPYEPKGFIPVDVNEDSVAIMIDGITYLFETGFKKIVLGYYYRRRSIQKRYDGVYGAGSRIARRIMRKLKERKRKDDVRWKIASLIVKVAYERGYGIILEKLDDEAIKSMISRVKDDQLRHRIAQSSLRGTHRAIELEAEKYGVPIVYRGPRRTSTECPLHKTRIVYANGSRVGRCSLGGELWHREVVACWNLLLKAHPRRWGQCPKPRVGLSLDGSPIPLGSTATHEPIGINKSLWARWKSLEGVKHHKHPLGTNGF